MRFIYISCILLNICLLDYGFGCSPFLLLFYI
nr:MAG TPA: hypothetical protein [Bacteriophage sp.]